MNWDFKKYQQNEENWVPVTGIEAWIIDSLCCACFKSFKSKQVILFRSKAVCLLTMLMKRNASFLENHNEYFICFHNILCYSVLYSLYCNGFWKIFVIVDKNSTSAICLIVIYIAHIWMLECILSTLLLCRAYFNLSKIIFINNRK